MQRTHESGFKGETFLNEVTLNDTYQTVIVSAFSEVAVDL